jgi:hypothetical protein
VDGTCLQLSYNLFSDSVWDEFLVMVSTHYERYPAVTIFVGFAVGILSIGIMVGTSLACIKLYRRGHCCCRKGSYHVNDTENYCPVDTELLRYEAIPMNEIPPHRQQYRKPYREQVLLDPPRTPSNRARVMILDDRGRIPPYTLRSRSVDNQSDTYTTYYNFNVHKETTL